jgi:hypothetical protein
LPYKLLCITSPSTAAEMLASDDTAAEDDEASTASTQQMLVIGLQPCCKGLYATCHYYPQTLCTSDRCCSTQRTLLLKQLPNAEWQRCCCCIAQQQCWLLADCCYQGV